MLIIVGCLRVRLIQSGHVLPHPRRGILDPHIPNQQGAAGRHSYCKVLYTVPRDNPIPVLKVVLLELTLSRMTKLSALLILSIRPAREASGW